MQNASTSRYYRSIVGSMLLGLGALLSQGASATLMNADFSAGFAGWSGEIATFDFSGPGDSGIGPSTPPLDGNYPDNYILPGGGPAGDAKISTSAAGPVDTYFVSLFQDFTVDTVAPGSTLELDLTVTTMLTDPFNGAVELLDSTGTLFADLTAGGTFDITALAGTGATFQLFVVDGDLTLPALADMITIGGITFTETAAVPAPGSLLLVGLGLVGLWGRRRFDRRS